MTSIGVVIVNHNSCSHLRSCLESVRREQEHSVVVVDVASTDGSVEMLRNEHSWISCVALSDNFGYGMAANCGMAKLNNTYVLILNGDTILKPGTLAALQEHLDLNPRVGLVGPRLLNPDGTYQRSCRRFPGTAGWFLDNPLTGRIVSTAPAFRDVSLWTWRHDTRRNVPWVIGAAMAVRREAFDGVRGFSADYFMFYEDIDLCFRLRQAGWAVHFSPEAKVVHIGSVSTSQYREQMDAELRRSARVFYRSNYSPLRAAIMVAAEDTLLLFPSRASRVADRAVTPESAPALYRRADSRDEKIR